MQYIWIISTPWIILIQLWSDGFGILPFVYNLVIKSSHNVILNMALLKNKHENSWKIKRKLTQAACSSLILYKTYQMYCHYKSTHTYWRAVWSFFTILVSCSSWPLPFWIDCYTQIEASQIIRVPRLMLYLFPAVPQVSNPHPQDSLSFPGNLHSIHTSLRFSVPALPNALILTTHPRM